MKKLEFIEALNKRMGNRYHPKTVAVYLGRAYEQIIYDTYRRDFGGLDLHAKTFKNIPILLDEDQNTYYSELPVSIVKLPRPGDGILSINSMKGKDIEFVPIRSGEANLISDLEVGQIPRAQIPFYIMDGRIEYVESDKLSSLGKVKLRLVRSFTAFDMLEEVYIPGGKDELLFETAINIMSGKPPTKQINDGSDKTN